MNPLSPIFGVGVSIRNLLYDRGIFQAQKLKGRVVSVGNLSAGGSGKTPFVIMLGEMLASRDIKFDVLSRGYGRLTRGVALVDPDGTPEEYGDEPLLIARKLKCPVIVGEDRFAAGQFAERKFGPQLHLLDDGFQHRSLARDFDIVLVNAEDPNDRMLPVGRLREPLGTLRRADAVVLTNNTSPKLFPLKGKPVWQLERGISLVDQPARPIVFCGIARPRKFVAQLQEVGIVPASERFYRDHHPYSQRDINELISLRIQNRADGFITTEKDVINLGPLRAALGPIAVASVTMNIRDGEALIARMLGEPV